jgi:aminotransferase
MSREFVADRLRGLVQSDIRRMTRECTAVGGINLGQGICDLPTPPLVQAGAIEAIESHKSIYSYSEGIPELRQAIADKVRRDNNLTADPDTEIIVTVGASGGFAAAITALLNPGDGILIPEPYYGYHLNMAIVAGLKPQHMVLEPPEFQLTAQALESAIQEDTRAMVICTPSNPCGKMYTQHELEIVADVARRHDLLVITDEIYEYIRYDGRPHISPATVSDLRDRTVTIMGLSKTFSITGWRLGYVIAPESMARPITLVQDLNYVCAPTPLQYGAARGFQAPASFYEELQADYQSKRQRICDALTQARLPPIVPQGAYYVLADVSRLGHTRAIDAAMAILHDVGVATVPGSAFYRGDTGESLVRLCFAKENDILDEACNRLAALRA